MKVLVIGGGGREHALAWSLAKSPHVTQVLCAPGNAGTSRDRKCCNVGIQPTDLDTLVAFARDEEPGLTVVGPEAPLAAGIVEEWPQDLRIIGPDPIMAQLETNKAYAKILMREHRIPTAPFEIFHDPVRAIDYLASTPDQPWVVKASGLATGKGVIVCDDSDSATAAVRLIMKERAFGTAGDQIVIEDRLEGYEVSLIALSDGKTIRLLAPAQDYKRLLNEDRGPNTGGMGSYCPAPAFTSAHEKQVLETVIRPAVEATNYRGFIYAGIMWTKDGPMVLEYNCRLGDPETQVILPRLSDDLFEILWEAAGEAGFSSDKPLTWRPEAAVTVVMCSLGYPSKYETGLPIEGLEKVDPDRDDLIVFHAGTKMHEDQVVTAGGRVLNITALGATHTEARQKAYEAVVRIFFSGAYCRTDIALGI